MFFACVGCQTSYIGTVDGTAPSGAYSGSYRRCRPASRCCCRGRTIRWSATAGAALTLVVLLDPVIAQSSGNPVLWQTVVRGSTNSADIRGTVALQAGTECIAVVGVGDASSQRSAFGSKRFAP